MNGEINEGWWVVWSDYRSQWEIQRYDCIDQVFQTDEEARAYVESMAALGSNHHQEILDDIATRNSQSW